MSETNKSYRIRTNVGEETGNISIPVSLVQDFDSVDILSLSIKSIDEYRKHSANYGVVVGRVLANNGFGIPNAKISVFIDADSEDDAVMKYLYPYSSSFDENSDKVRYNLLPDEYVSDCHQIVGTFPNKRFMLDNDVLLEVFDKYYKFTTRTNKSGDYLICGVPTGRQTIHMDLDISDCGILSQRPRDFVYKGYNIEQFENPNKFKDGTNYNELSQIFTQDKTINVEPFWGNATDGESIGITRADINVAFKFEPTCVFMGSVVSDNASNGITQKCIATPHMGDMDELTTGEGTIEMIRKTPNGGVEEFQIKGTQLINANGVWCYQIPMNLDYMMTDEYGNMVPTDNPDKGIPTRARVRFRLSLTDNENAKESYYRPKVLVPNNPDFKDGRIDYDYIFGTDTQEDSYRDLFWNNVYSVKSFIPRFQKSRLFKHAWKDEKFTGIKHCNIFGPNNPIPYNNIRFRIPFMFLILCALINAFIRVVGYVNTVITVLYKLIMTIAEAFDKIGDGLSGAGSSTIVNIFTLGISSVIGSIGKVAAKISNSLSNFASGTFRYVTIDDGLCPDLERWYFAPKGYNDDLLKLTIGDLASEIETESSNAGSTLLIEDSTSTGYKNREEKSICITNLLTYLITCVEMNLAQEYKIINFDFYNDWVNGMIYIPRYKKYIRPKSTFLGFIKIRQKIKGCIDDSSIYDNSRMFTQMCSLNYKLNGSKLEAVKPDEVVNKYYEKSSKRTIDIFNKGGVVHETETMLGQKVFYLKPSEINNFKKVNLYSTDLILLGSLNDCDIYGIPQAFKNLTSSSYLLPPNMPITNLEETGPLYANAIPGTTCKTIKIGNKESQVVGSALYPTIDSGYSLDNNTENDNIDQSAGDELNNETVDGYNIGVSDENESRNIYSAFRNDTGEIEFSENEHADLIALTEMSGIAWNWDGPSQGKSERNKIYYPGGHFLGIACWNIETNLKTCVNLSRICEIGGGMSERQEDAREIDEFGNVKYTYNVPTGLIGNEAIIDGDFRSMFSTMNMKKLVANKKDKNGYIKYDFLYLRPNGFDGAMRGFTSGGDNPYNKKVNVDNNSFDYLSEYSEDKVSVGNSYDNEEINQTQTKTLENVINDYYRFRLGLDKLSDASEKFLRVNGDGHYSLPMYENSFYFYFGLKDGATALDEFNKQFFSNCESRLIKDNEPQISAELDNENGYNYDTGISVVNVKTKNVPLPYDAFLCSFKQMKQDSVLQQWSARTDTDSVEITNGLQEDKGLGVYNFKTVFNDGITLQKSLNVGDNLFSAEFVVHGFQIELNDVLDERHNNEDGLGGYIEMKNLNIRYYGNSTPQNWKIRYYNLDMPSGYYCPHCHGRTFHNEDHTYHLLWIIPYTVSLLHCSTCGAQLQTPEQKLFNEDDRLKAYTTFEQPLNNNFNQNFYLNYHGNWRIELWYRPESSSEYEKMYSWGPFNVQHFYSPLYVEDISKNNARISEDFKNYYLDGNNQQIEWWKNCSVESDILFRTASLDTRPGLKTLDNAKNSTISTDEYTSIKSVFGFLQKIKQTSGNDRFSIEQPLKLLGLNDVFDDTNNPIGGTGPEGEEYNYYFITSKNVNNGAYWHIPVPKLKVENGIIKTTDLSNSEWKRYVKVGHPCIYIDEGTKESVQDTFTGIGTNAPNGITNGIIKPMLFYPVLNRPYKLNFDVVEWYGRSDNNNIVVQDRPEWARYMDVTGFFDHFTTLGWCMSGSVISPYSSCTVSGVCESKFGDEIGNVQNCGSCRLTRSQIWTENPHGTNLIFQKIDSATSKKSRFDSTYKFNAQFSNNGESFSELKKYSDIKNNSAIGIYTGNVASPYVDIVLYYANRIVNYDVKYYWFPFYTNDNKGAVDKSILNRFDYYDMYYFSYPLNDDDMSWLDPSQITGSLYVTYNSSDNTMFDVQDLGGGSLNLNEIKTRLNGTKFYIAYIQPTTYSVPILLSDENNRLTQVAIFIDRNVWTKVNPSYIWSSYNTYISNPTAYYLDDYTIQAECNVGSNVVRIFINIATGENTNYTSSPTGYSNFMGFGTSVGSDVTRANVCENVNGRITNLRSYYSASTTDWDVDGNPVLTVLVNQDIQGLKEYINSNMQKLRINLNGTNKYYYPAKRLKVNEGILDSQTGVTKLVSFLKEYENDSHIIHYGGNKGTDNEIVSERALNYGVDNLKIRNFGVFSVFEKENDHGGKNKIYKIYPHLINRSLMHEIEQWRKTAGEGGTELII